jgi:hypothetical protein|tara:strand:- start:2936 stop:3580 length:645 start_codon:yes stop_codon:yes gene_type:complete
MSAIQGTIATVDEWISEIDSLTAAGGALNCDAIQLQINTYVSTITDVIAAKVSEMLNLLAQYSPLLSIPSDPMKILSWVKKFVTGIAGPAIAAAIQLAIDIALLAAKIAGIAGAVVNLALKLADCLTNIVQNTLNDLASSVMDGAIAIKDQAIGIYESLKDQLLEQLGFNEISALSEQVSNAVVTVDASINSVNTSVADISGSKDSFNNIQVPG